MPTAPTVTGAALDVLTALGESGGAGLFITGGHGDVLASNGQFLELLGLPSDGSTVHMSWLRAVHPEDREWVEMALGVVESPPGDDVTIEFRLAASTGRDHWVRMRHAQFEASRDTPQAQKLQVGCLMDIDVLKSAKPALRQIEARLQGHSSILRMIATNTPLETILATVCRLLEHELGGATVSIEVADSVTSTCETHAEAAWSTAIRSSSDDRVLGTVFMVDGPADSGDDDFVDCVFQLAAIAIEHHAFEERLAVQAQHDPLTGLPNRALFAELLDHALARAQRSDTALAVLFLDLDRFKVVNDNFGHEAGDDVLATLGQRLQRLLRPGDVLARFGGDEFTLLCEDLDAEAARRQAAGVAERIMEALRDPFVVGGAVQYLGASIGIAIAASGDDRADVLLRNADAAMYRAKRRGRDRVEVFDEGMRDRAVQRRAVEHELHGAADRDELRVFYQPVISLIDGACTGVEALLRWQHPQRGLLGPADFLSAAEDTGLIVSIGSWLLEEACGQVLDWQRDQLGPQELRVAVNFSPRQLVQHDFDGAVSAILDRTGLPASALCVEITETALIEDLDAGVSAVSALKAAGVRTSIDDFGTGYSALGYLRKFPIDEVKIHQSFVERLGTDPHDSAIISAVVSLSHALGMTVTGEGVETQHQLDELRNLGVDAAQGYLFAAPQPADDLRSALARTRAWV